MKAFLVFLGLFFKLNSQLLKEQQTGRNLHELDQAGVIGLVRDLAQKTNLVKLSDDELQMRVKLLQEHAREVEAYNLEKHNNTVAINKFAILSDSERQLYLGDLDDA